LFFLLLFFPILPLNLPVLVHYENTLHVNGTTVKAIPDVLVHTISNSLALEIIHSLRIDSPFAPPSKRGSNTRGFRQPVAD
jgi:hypothetical protein